MSRTPNYDQAGMTMLLLQSNVFVFRNDRISLFYGLFFIKKKKKLEKVEGPSGCRFNDTTFKMKKKPYMTVFYLDLFPVVRPKMLNYLH